MTGWQSGDGGQGNWNQPSFGPDPQTNQYGVDPHGNQYGADPYANPYAANPYADPNAPNPYAAGPYGGDQYQQPQYPPTGGFPAQPQYPPTGGFPMQGYGPPPPPKRSKLPMILSLVAIVIIIGAVVTIVLVNRNGTQPVAQDDPTTSSTSKTSPSSKSSGSSSRSPDGEHDDWLTIDNTDDSGLSYQLPPDWQQLATTRPSGKEVDFTGGAEFGVYECEGASYVRTFAASGAVKGENGAELDMATTLEDFANSFGLTYYGADAKVDVPSPTETKVGDTTAMTVTAKITPTVTKPACQATEGEVALVGIPLEEDGKQTAIAMLVVVNDLAGGPADPAPLAASVTAEILSTVRVG